MVIAGAGVAALAAALTLAPAAVHGRPPAVHGPAAVPVALSTGGGTGLVPDLRGPAAVGPFTRGRLLVLRPDRLLVVQDGRVVREVAVRQPLDLGDLPWLVGDPAYAAPPDDGSGVGVRLGAVLVQGPGTSVTGVDLRLQFADSGGGGAARITGSSARLLLRGTTVTAVPTPRQTPGRGGMGAGPGAVPGLRYLHGSDVILENVTLAGLGGRDGDAAAVRADGGRTLLRRVAVRGGGPGVAVTGGTALVVDGLDGDRVGGDVLEVAGGSGALIRDVSSQGAAGAAVELRGGVSTGIDGLTSTGDTLALAADGVDGLDAVGVRAYGGGLLLGGRGVRVGRPDVDAAVEGLRVRAGGQVTIDGGQVRGRVASVVSEARAGAGGNPSEGTDADGVELRGVATAGPVLGPVHVGSVAAAARAPWWPRPAGGVGLLALVVVVVAGVALDLARGRRGNRSGPDTTQDVPAVTAPAGEFVLDLGEQPVR